MKTLSFRSKVDLWLGAILVAAPAYVLWQSLTFGSYVSLIVIGAVYLGILFPMRYELTEDALVVRSGFITYRRPYTEIVSVTPNRSPFSAPALSLDRIMVRSHSGRAMNISPNDREQFLKELCARATHLTHTNEGGLTS